ncbi:MAG: FG-GAP-like repeat-containing protein [Dysgonamonadaceae bacterium]|jgi:RHS repeat-associated protein|nr:FG-GAP-like repeat-containing protein [Dysgonamonadaceae bacterium]
MKYSNLCLINRKKMWSATFAALMLFLSVESVCCQTGNTMANPIIVGSFIEAFNYSNTQSTSKFTNNYNGRSTDDVFYKFTIGKKMLVTLTHCGSMLQETSMHLLDASGNVATVIGDYFGDGACPEPHHPFIQKELNAGTYYVVSEGLYRSGLITTRISGITAGEFDYPEIPNTYSTDPETVGSMGGSFSVSSMGGATYSIPIEVPSGVGGMQPLLAIVYNSQSGNGLLGWGCNLSGLSAITRTPKDIYHDGTAKGLTHKSDEAYCLDGQRLILASGTAGANGAVYYPESDPFTKITIKTTSSNTWFEVQFSNGLKYNYGSTSSGRLTYTINGETRVHAWHLDYVEDPLGNYMEYSYNVGYFMYPDRITYGKNKNQTNILENTVIFNYDERFDDYSAFFIDENVKSCLCYILQSIVIKTGDNVFRTLDFKYHAANDSRLVSVTQKNEAGEVMKPLKLNWNYFPSFSQSYKIPSLNQTSVPISIQNITTAFPNQNYMAADINGDGLDDLLGIFPHDKEFSFTTNIVFVNYASLNSSGNVQFTDSTKWYDIGSSYEIKNWSVDKDGPSVLDFNGDGVSDLLIPEVKNNKSVNFKFACGALHNLYIDIPLTRSDQMPVYNVGDFNNDGKTDIIFIEKGYKKKEYKGKGYKEENPDIYPCVIIEYKLDETPCTPFEIYLPSRPEKLFVSDYNNDGLKDLMVFYKGGYTIFWNKGSGISASTFSDSYKTSGTNIGDDDIWTGDFDGDGVADFLVSSNMSPNWYFALNKGDGTFTKQLACTLDIYEQDFTDRDNDKFSCKVYDFDFDGKSDVVITKAMYTKKQDKFLGIEFGSPWGEFRKTYTYWMHSTGSSLIPVASSSSDIADDSLISKYLLGDFNGDGQPELMNYGYDCYNSVNANTDPGFKIYSNPNFNVNKGKVTSITDEFGHTTEITYASLATGGVYTKGTGSAYPVADYTLPLHVVKTVLEDNGVAGSITVNYKYKGLKAHLQGKGLMGMTSQTVNNTTLGTTTESGVTKWNTTFYIPSETFTKYTVDGKTAENTITLTIKDKGSRKFFAYPSEQKENDLDGNTTTTNRQFDPTYGYMTEEKVVFNSNMYKTVKYENYVSAGNTWKPRLITKVQKHEDDDAAFTQKTSITYNSAKGYRTQVIENSQSSLQLTTDFTYDVFGNVKSSKSSSTGVTQLVKYNDYDATGRFVVKTYTSPASSVNTFTYDKWGNVIAEKDETNPSNILTTTHTYDCWGNLISSTSPEGLKTTVRKGWNVYSDKRFFTLTQGTGQPWVKIWYDTRGREVLVETVDAMSMRIKYATSYNDNGLVIEKKTTAGNLTATESYTYDKRGRVETQSSSTGQTVSYTYGNRSITCVSNGRTTVKKYDAWGNIKSVKDPVSSVNYTYTSLGKPKYVEVGGISFLFPHEYEYEFVEKQMNTASYSETSTSVDLDTTVPLEKGTTYSMTYDDTGNQLTLTDPNAGTITFNTRDALGRVRKQTDAKGQVTETEYDALGRVTSSKIAGIQTSYTYGTSGYDLLRLVREQTGNTYISYSYDKYGRVLTEKRQTDDSGLLEFGYTYNSKGQVEYINYPGSLKVNRQYDTYGNLKKVMVGTQAIWELTGNTGTVTTVKKGGVFTTTETRNAKGYLSCLKTVQGSNSVHEMNFIFDEAKGNLIYRSGMGLQRDSFIYDAADRLTAVWQGSDIMNIYYFANGNISYKSGLGSYRYEKIPYAVSRVENTDDLIPWENQQIGYTTFNKVSYVDEKIGNDSYLLDISYGPDQQRWKSILKKNGIVKRTVVYAGDYETVTENGTTKQLYYITGGDGLAAVYVKQSGLPDKVYYAFTDQLGSIVKLIDANGGVVFAARYDAWGNRTVTNNTFAFHRGYTGHEHLPEFNLINMNGRMYDPVLGRFLSPDPFVQVPDFSQSFNRYSYCLNNPLKYTDPSGYVFGIDDIIVIAAFAYFGGMQANFAFSAGNGTNPFNPGNWNWKSAHTYIGIVGGGMSGAAMAGYSIPYLQVPGMIPNGTLQAGVQVTLNGIGNVTDGRNFFDNWYWSAGMGFASGAYTGYGLAKEKGLNYWWGNEIAYNRTAWSFYNVDKPDYVIDFGISNVGSKAPNDCVPTTFAEIEIKKGGSLSYNDYVTRTDYKYGFGVSGSVEDYQNMVMSNFNGEVLSNQYLAFSPEYMKVAAANGNVISFDFGNHADNVRKMQVFSLAPSKNKLIFRNSNYNFSFPVGDKKIPDILNIFRIY